MNARVREILSWYTNETPGVRANLARIMNHGRLGGSGKFVILPVDQGFEHGPLRSFIPNPPAYDPDYHFQLAIEAGCNAYAAPLGFIQAGADRFAGELPLILKANNSDTLYTGTDPCPAVTASVQDALALGCAAIGFTIYPGSALRNDMYEQIREMTAEAKACGLAVVIWSYPRGSGISKDGETAVDVSCYAAQIACQLGANIVKVKPPTEHVEQGEAKKLIEKHSLGIASLADRVRLVVKSAFNGKRIVIFSGGAAKSVEEILTECRGIRDGGGFGTIMGRNSFQRPKDEALKLLAAVMDIYAGKDVTAATERVGAAH
jgi:fructose-bisphosphate aldolase, class I